ncbi:MAG: hypothetical protein ACI9W2_002436, partial [Gammaproteobacteria bacterium]
ALLAPSALTTVLAPLAFAREYVCPLPRATSIYPEADPTH